MDLKVLTTVIFTCLIEPFQGYLPMNDYGEEVYFDGPLISPNNHIYDNIGYFPVVFPKQTTTTSPGGAGVMGRNAIGQRNENLNPITESPLNTRTNNSIVLTSVNTTTTATTTSTTTADKIPHTSTTTHPGGFLAPYQPIHLVGFHVKGGTILKTNITKSVCKKLCEEDESCLALDYDSFNQLCWKHGEDTHCGAVNVQLGTSHYKKVSCKKKIDNLYKEITLGAFVSGGSRFCCPCSLSTCLYMCAQRVNECKGVDYSWKGRACYSHNNNTACGKVVSSKHTSHYSKVVCETTLQTSPSEYWNTLGTIENLTAGSKVVYIRGPAGEPGPPGPPGPIPTESPQNRNQLSYTELKKIFLEGLAAESGYSLVPATQPPEENDTMISVRLDDEEMETEPIWTEYENFSIPEGEFLLGGITKQQCKDLCDGDSSCVSVDYNQYNEGCWYHNSSRTCDELTESKNVFHIRKKPCDDSVS